MNVPHTVGQDLAKAAGRFAAHIFAILLGLILSVVGLGMGVSMALLPIGISDGLVVSIALLPIGIPVGLVGMALLLRGLFGAEEMKVPPHLPAWPSRLLDG